MVADMSNRVLLPLALRAIREAKAQTNPDLRTGKFATACVLSGSHLSNIEAGRKRPSQEFIYRAAALLSVSPDALSYVDTNALEATA